MISIPKTQAVILSALLAEKERYLSLMADLDAAWMEVIAPLLPDGRDATEFVVVKDGGEMHLREREAA